MTATRTQLIVLALGGIAAIGGTIYWQKGWDQRRTVRRTRLPQPPPPSSRDAALPPAGRPVAALKQLVGGPGLIVCDPLPTAVNADEAAFGDGCSRWLDIVVSGQPEFGQSPGFESRARAVLELETGSLRLSSSTARKLTKPLGITHAVVGELSASAGASSLTYRLIDLASGHEMGEPITFTGAQSEIAAHLPETARRLCERLGATAPKLPDSTQESAADLAALGRLAGVTDVTPAYSKALEKLSTRSSLAQLYFARARGLSGDSIEVISLGTELVKRYPGNPYVYSVVADAVSGAGQGAGLVDAAKLHEAMRNHPNNHLFLAGQASFSLAAGDPAGARRSAEQAVCCAARNPDAWVTLSNLISNEANATRRGRFPGQMTPAEGNTIESLYSQWVPVCRRAVELDPQHEVAWVNLSTAAAFSGDQKLAEQAIWKAINTRPGNAYAYAWGLQLFARHWYYDEEKFQKIARLCVKDAFRTSRDRLYVAKALWGFDGKAEANGVLRSAGERQELKLWASKNDGSATLARTVARTGGAVQGEAVTSHTSPVSAVAWDPNGALLASGSADKTVHLWDPSKSDHHRLLGHTDSVTSLAWAADGSVLATGSADRTIRIWKPKSEKEEIVLAGSDGPVTSLSWHPTAARLASSSGQIVKIWNVGHAKPLLEFQTTGFRVLQASYSPNGKLIACSSDWSRDLNTIAALWDPETRKLVRPLAGHQSAVRTLAWSPDGNYIATGSDDLLVRVFAVATGKLIRQFAGHEGAPLVSAWTPDGRFLATGDTRQLIRIWEPSTGREAGVWEGHTGRVTGLSWNPVDGRLSSGGDQRVFRWSGKPIPGRMARSTLGAQPAGPPLLRGRERALALEAAGATGAVAFSADEKLLAVGSETGIGLHSTQDGSQISHISLPARVEAIAFSPDGGSIVGASTHAVTCWDPRSGKVRWTWKDDEGTVEELVFSPDGQRVVGLDELPYRILAWDASTGKLVKSAVEEGMTRGLAYAPDGKSVAVGIGAIYRWGDVNVWDASLGMRKRTLEGHENMVSDVAFSRDGGLLASASYDRTVRIWDTSNWKLQKVLHGHPSTVSVLEFVAEGRTLITGDQDGRLRVWSSTGTLREIVDAGQGMVREIAGSSGGRFVAVSSMVSKGAREMQILLWRLP